MRVAHLDGFAAPELSAATLNHMASMSMPTSTTTSSRSPWVVLVRRPAVERQEAVDHPSDRSSHEFRPRGSPQRPRKAMPPPASLDPLI